MFVRLYVVVFILRQEKGNEDLSFIVTDAIETNTDMDLGTPSS